MSLGDRLTAAAVLGGLRQRSWSLLILSAFLVLAAAGSAGPMFAEASDNAAFQVRRDQIPATARQNDAAVVRVSADYGPRSIDQEPVLADLRSVPGLTPPDLTGGSIGAELAAPGFWGFWAGVGDRLERGRLFAVASPSSELVAVGAPAAADGLWLPQPMAAALRVRPGDQIELTLRQGARGKPRKTPTTVRGIYAVDAVGRLPADVPGSRKWALRNGDTPGDTEFETLPAHLLIGDVATVERLALAVDDPIFWSVESALDPAATLTEARRTADEVEYLRRRYAQELPSEVDSPAALRFATGIGRIVANAQATTEAVRQRTQPVEWAAIAVGLASVLAVALLSARRRSRELRHAAAVGLSPLRVGGLWLLEHLLPAAIGAGLGWLAAWQLVLALGPPGVVQESLAPSARNGVLAVLAGLVVVAAIGAVAAARQVRPATPATARRVLPWGSMVVIAALVAAAGLLGAGGPAGGVDLLVPLLVLAAVGVIVGWLPGLLAGGKLSGSPVLWLARRRLASGGTERRLTVVVVTAGLGMLLFAISAVRTTSISADDRIAVAAGAEGVGVLEGSWQLDDAAIPIPPEDPERPYSDQPVPGVRVPPMPPGSTIVWRTDVRTLLDDDQKDLLIIDPATFESVAMWGRGPDLAAARKALAALAAQPADDGGRARVIAVGDPASEGVDTIRMRLGFADQYFELAARVPAFPGMRGRPMYVAAADPTLGKLSREDPRLRPVNQQTNQLFPIVYVWSSGGADGVQAVAVPHGVQPERVSTAATLRQDGAYVATSRARGYQLAIAGYLALLAILTLCVYAQRTAVLRRPADLMLARVGLGRRRIGQARTLEFVLLAVIALAGAGGGVAALAPLGARLLDDQPGLLPRLTFQLSPLGLAITAGAAVVATLLTVAVTRSSSASSSASSATSEEAAYRDD